MMIQDPAQHAKFARDLVHMAQFLRGRSDVEPRKVGSVGFFFGGGMSTLLACEDPDLGDAVTFYGNSPSADNLSRTRRPVLGLQGAEDHRITDTTPVLAD